MKAAVATAALVAGKKGYSVSRIRSGRFAQTTTMKPGNRKPRTTPPSVDLATIVQNGAAAPTAMIYTTAATDSRGSSGRPAIRQPRKNTRAADTTAITVVPTF